MSREVFVIGGVHHNALGVIRSLGEKDVCPYVIVESNRTSRPYICRSRYIKKYWVVNSAEDVIITLKREARKFPEKPVLIICSDNLASLVDIKHDELSQYLILPGAKKQGRITHYMNKEVMTSFARDIGFHVPASVSVMNLNSAEANDINIPYPWIVKPLMSINGEKSDIKRIYNKGEWDYYCKNHNISVQVQNLIEKEYEFQLLGLSLESGRNIIIPGRCFCLRPSENTNTGFVHFVNCDSSVSDIVTIGRSFIKEIGYSGLFSLEFIHSNYGVDYFMEMNFRNDANAYSVTKAGVNLPYIWANCKSGENWKNENTNIIKDVYVLPLFFELSLWGKGMINFRMLFSDIIKADYYADYSSDDPKPTYGKLRFFIRFVKLLMVKIAKHFHNL